MNLAVETFFAVVTICLFLVSSAVKPSRARCPRGWWLGEGVSENGTFACYPPGDDKYLEQRAQRLHPADVLRSKIYCTNGMRPIIAYDGETVGCQRGGWSF